MKHVSAFGELVTRADIETHIDALIELLDEIDGDCDLEDGDIDCCAAFDDDPASSLSFAPIPNAGFDCGPGDPLDGEPEH